MFLEPEKNLAQFHIDPGMKVADMGAGVGFYAFLISGLVGPSGKVYAFDVVKELLSKLKNEALSKNLNNIEVIWSDLDEVNGTTLQDGAVDRVVITNTLFQMEKKDIFIQEAYRILKPHGKMMLVDWSDSYAGVGPMVGEVVKPDAARVLCEHAGFVFEKEISAGDHHYGFVFKKK
jgi:ubiquinone/menaquinone biosynthesis C-methylase UbiE